MTKEEVKTYLERIDCKDAEEISLKNLARLIRAHLEHIPFEDLDVFDRGETPSLNEKALFHKVVENKRGGYCFELNILFRILLETMGYSVYSVAARVLWNKESLPPLSHIGLVVCLEEKKYFCDVGYGGPGPKGVTELKEGKQTVAGEDFCIRHLKEGDILIERQHHGIWKALLQFADRPVRKVDFELLNFYFSQNPVAAFKQHRIVNLCTPQGSKALMDMELTVHERGEVKKKVYKDMKELKKGLEEEFGIRFLQ